MSLGSTVEDTELQNFLRHLILPEKLRVPMKNSKQKVIVLSGPTGVGKTKLSLLIAKVLGGEIISCDSMQVYRGMDIGTAKVSREDREHVPHHLIDIRDIHEGFNVTDFYREAHLAIQSILARGAVPIVVGGTGFYIHALLYGPPNGPASDFLLRHNLEMEIEEKGPSALYERLKMLDPEYAATITRNDRHKIVRALEIMSLSDKKVSEFSRQHFPYEQEYNFRCWFLHLPKELLYPAIEMRCDQMLKEGFIEEVKELETRGIRKNSTASQAIGYRQCLEYLASHQSGDDWHHFVLSFKQASRRYAKRQFTWFRKEPLFRWVNRENILFEHAAEMIIQDFELSF